MSELGPSEKLALVQQYAAGTISWRELQERGFDDYIQVLAGLGELGLRPPRAPTGEPVNVRFSLIVTDTSPLFTLALADSLDALLHAGL